MSDWPSLYAPGLYRAKCPCGLEKTGTARELAHFKRLHDDGSGSHVVSIADDGQRTDLPAEDPG